MLPPMQASAPYWVIHDQSWREVGEILLAFVLSAVIGLEREARQKNAGVRTHALVGTGAALIMVISKYGFSDVLWPGHIVLDPSRVAAQIVSGLGFIGGGLIFVRRDAVRGLTTAAIVWVTAAVGMACGAGLWILALLVTCLHFMIVFAFPPLLERVGYRRVSLIQVRLVYRPAAGVLPRVLELLTRRGIEIVDVDIEHGPSHEPGKGDQRERAREEYEERAADTTVVLRLRGVRSAQDLAVEISDLPGVHSVTAGEQRDTGE